MEENKKIIEILISTIECYRGGFIGEEDFISRIDDGLQELLQHNVSNRRKQLIAFCEYYKNGKYLFEKWSSEEVVGIYLKSN